MTPARPIRKLLIANRGEVARRIIRTAHRMGIATVAVFSEADAREPFVREADEAVRLGGAAAADSYLRIDRILDAAKATGADAVHPGYGFLAENAAFARACEDAGIVFVGPRPEVIEAMGSKLGAKRLLATAGVPTLADADVTGLEGDELVAAAAAVGYPLLVKPSAGGGGKGMRAVAAEHALLAAVAASRREASAAFGDDTMLLERYVESGRHVEVQILGDHHGTVTHLYERECSIQRRHQKILEETPCVALTDEVRAALTDAAVAAGKALGYTGAGTVEFLLAGAADGAPSSEFFFLEVNTRLQVEHPVTEMVTGLDLVRLQLEIAAGGAIPDTVMTPARQGHAIEVRLYAEDPRSDFLPQTGTITRLCVPRLPGLRVDAGPEAGSEVSVHYDPMLAKVIAHAATRDEAARVLARALRRTELDGLRTNRDFLVRLLEHEAFLSGDIDTRFLEREAAATLTVPLVGGEDTRLAAVAAALAGMAHRRAAASVQRTIATGFRNHLAHDQTTTFSHDDGEIVVAYRFKRGTLEAVCADGRPLDVAALRIEPDAVSLELDSRRHEFSIRTDGPRVRVNSAVGQCDLVEAHRFPDPAAGIAAGSLVAPMPGAVIRVDRVVGDSVECGAPLLVLEAMKMEHEIVAPTNGVISALPVAVGDQVDTGTLLAAIDSTDPIGDQ